MHLIPPLHFPPSRTHYILWYPLHTIDTQAEAWKGGDKHQEKVFTQQRGRVALEVQSLRKRHAHT